MTAPIMGPDMPIEELHLEPHIYRSLVNNGVWTVRQLTARTEADLLTMRNIGPGRLAVLKGVLAGYGLALKASAGYSKRTGPC